MIKIICTTDNNEYSEQVKEIWEELSGSLKRNYNLSALLLPLCLHATHRRWLLTQWAAIQSFSPHIFSCAASSALNCMLFKRVWKPWLFVLRPITMASEFTNNIIHHCNILRARSALLSLFYRLQNDTRIKVKYSVISSANFISDMIFPSAQYQTTFHTFSAQTLIDFSCSCKPSAFLHISP